MARKRRRRLGRSCWRATRDAWRRRDDDDGGDDDCGDDDCAGRGGDDDAGGAPEGTELRGDNGCGDDGRRAESTPTCAW